MDFNDCKQKLIGTDPHIFVECNMDNFSPYLSVNHSKLGYSLEDLTDEDRIKVEELEVEYLEILQREGKVLPTDL